MYIVGIDPGQSGGVFFELQKTSQFKLCRFDGKDPLKVLEGVLPETPLCIILEQVHAMPGQGVTSMFSFGVGYGKLQGYFYARSIEVTLVPPQRWQKILGSGEPKAAVKSYCEEKWGLDRFIFPKCRVPHQGCMDAAVIADWGRKLYLGEVEPAPVVKVKMRRRPVLRL